MKREEFIILLDKYVKGTADEHEKALYENFYQHFQKDDATFWAAQDALAKTRLEQQIQQSINDAINAEESKMASKRIWLTPFFKVAATLLLVAAVSWLIIRSTGAEAPVYLEKATGSGETALVELADGSRVLLSAGSSLSYPESFTEDLRKVELKGEAFFEVTRDAERPFIVNSGELSTRVLGTSFNIMSYAADEAIEVTVATGKVQVSTNEQIKVELTPGEQAIYTKNARQLSERAVSLDKFLAWREGMVFMDNTPLSELIQKLENWFGVNIELENESLGTCPINGKYKLDTLENIMASLKLIHGIEYESVAEKQLKLTGKICN